MSERESSDEAVQATNDDATLCKRSAVQLGYWRDPYLQHFVRSTERKAPEINRGYYARVVAIKHLLDKAIQVSGENCQIISLGAGFDTLFWRLKDDGKVIKNFTEIDFPLVTSRKCYAIKRSKPLLQGIATEDGEVKLSHSDLHGATYHIAGCDLRSVNELAQKLKESQIDYSIPTIILSECVLVYMEVHYSSILVQWLADQFKTCLFINYEQVNMEDRFGQVMVDNLIKRGCGLSGVSLCKNIDTQKSRFLQNNWQKAEAWTMSQVYSMIPQADVQRIEKIEFLDERELLDQLFQHYCITVAYNDEHRIGYQNVKF